MNVRDLLDVRAICESGSLRKAAVLLGVTQPTLSHRIAHLEDQLGAQLFDRSRGQSRPTDLALFIASRAGTLADEAERLTREAKLLAAGRAGPVRIGLGPGPTRMLFAGIVATIVQRWPELSIEMVSGQTSQLGEGLLRRELDLLVCPPLDARHNAIASAHLLETDLVIVARPDHPMCANPPASIPEAFRYPIATPFMEQRYLHLLRDAYGIDISEQAGRVVCSDFDMLVRIVKQSSHLFMAGPRFAFAREIAAGELRVIDLDIPFKHVIELHSNRTARSLPIVGRVKAVIEEAFIQLRAAPPG